MLSRDPPRLVFREQFCRRVGSVDVMEVHRGLALIMLSFLLCRQLSRQITSGRTTMMYIRVTSALTAATLLTLASYAQAQSIPPSGELHVTYTTTCCTGF